MVWHFFKQLNNIDTAKGYRVPFRKDKNVLKLDGIQAYEYTKKILHCTF